MSAEEDAYHELCAYTLSHGKPEFIHQYVVDAWAAQHANEHSKPIGVTFALVGLYLHVERNFTGRQVQLAHMDLAREKHPWPKFVLPQDRGAKNAIEVLQVPAGPERDRAIHEWAESVWTAMSANREAVTALLREHKII